MAAASVMNTIGAAASSVGRTCRRGLSSLRISPAKSTKQASKLSSIVPDSSMVDTEFGNGAYSRISQCAECPSTRTTTLDDAHPSKCAAEKGENSDVASYTLLESSPPASHIGAEDFEDFDEDASVFDPSERAAEKGENSDVASYTLLGSSPPASHIGAEDFEDLDEATSVFDPSGCAAEKGENSDAASHTLLEYSPDATDIGAEDFDEDASVFDD